MASEPLQGSFAGPLPQAGAGVGGGGGEGVGGGGRGGMLLVELSPAGPKRCELGVGGA